MVSVVSKLNAAAYRLNADRVINAGRRLSLLLKANFNPSQPRVPAGSADGGRWTDGGGATGGDGHIIRVGDPNILPRLDLLKEEGYNGAHTLRFHSGKSAEELLERMGPPASRWAIVSGAVRRNGSFDSDRDATYYVNDVTASNAEIVRQVASGAIKDEFITKRYGFRTGIEAYRDTPYSEPLIRQTYGVGVHIVHDPRRQNGSYVNTAYPRNDDPMTKKLVTSPAFRSFTSFMIQDFEMFASLDDVIRFGLQLSERRNPSYTPELKSYLKAILSPSVSDAQIGQLWNSSGAEFGGHDRFIRSFLQRTLAILEEDAPNGVLKKKPIRYKEA
ncbi:RNase A-like domain-containing protein [Rhizobium sp. C1]|uniref:RNase A-like domain-containing protein n=1 Tax=Rhizobium sp. C1 TaxID=1349799 RepID=UPI001E45EC87|nr:RNase A-like domain-containing protein [Rhizobium sp. C1]MCD2177799.1 hypothetical protein [Rhizobium sp. C1]